ncbi:MAG: geranylgeranylglyceryl/heptaprenylglyceryl phosphate synthase [Bacteroidales bacterium]
MSDKKLHTLLIKEGRKKISVLIDPDKHTKDSLVHLIRLSEEAGVDFFLIGGSLLQSSIEETIDKVKAKTTIPIILFPGNLLQLSPNADGMLLLSLISGRNPDLLIGNHVIAAPVIRKAKIFTIPTGYILVDTGKTTSVEYMSNTKAIPSDKPDIAVATAMAGEMLGLKVIYLDAGSGAHQPVPEKMVEMVRQNISIPLIVGGGIKTRDQVERLCSAGADIIVVGNYLEENANKIKEFAEVVQQF